MTASDKVKAAIDGHMQRVQRKVALAAIRTLTRVTPVVSGRAKGGWDAGINSTPIGETGRLDKTGNATVAAVMAVVDPAPPYSRVEIVNNVEYVKYLDEGTPKFAPFAMVRTAAATIEANRTVLAKG